MNAAVRIAKLSARVGRVRPPDAPDLPETNADWLAVFERYLSDGSVATEPDFPRAVGLYRAAVAAAGTPVPARPDPAAGALWVWLVAMLDRAWAGEPGVTEAEFADLADWFRANEERVRDAIRPGQLLDLGDGVRESLANLRWGIGQGPRAPSAGGVAEKLRKARAVYGGRPARLRRVTSPETRKNTNDRTGE